MRFTFTNCDSMARRCVAGVVAAHSRLVGVGVLGSSCTWRVHFVFILGGGLICPQFCDIHFRSVSPGIIDRYEQQFYIGSQDRTVGFKGSKRVGKTTITKREETGEPDGQKMGNL